MNVQIYVFIVYSGLLCKITKFLPIDNKVGQTFCEKSADDGDESFLAFDFFAFYVIESVCGSFGLDSGERVVVVNVYLADGIGRHSPSLTRKPSMSPLDSFSRRPAEK